MVEFLRIKGESHGPFEEARALEAFSKSNTEFKGSDAGEALCAKLETGVLLVVDLSNTELDAQAVAGLVKSGLESKTSRLTTLMYVRFRVHACMQQDAENICIL